MTPIPPRGGDSTFLLRYRPLAKLQIAFLVIFLGYFAQWIAISLQYQHDSGFADTHVSKHLNEFIDQSKELQRQSKEQSKSRPVSKPQQPTSSAHPPPPSTEESSDQSIDNDKPFLQYQLHNNEQPYNITFGYFTKCNVGVTTNKWGRKPIRRVELSPEFQSIFNVTTTIQTNLKILSLGDSVGIQFHQLLEEAVGATWENRSLYQFAWGAHESVSVAAPIQGGGVVAAFRMTGMLLERGRGLPPPNKSGGGWLPEHVQQLLNHSYYNPKVGAPTSVTDFDAMIFRIPHGWLTLDEITEETLRETIYMANKLFGIRTAVVMTLPLNNNVKSVAELEHLRATNVMIHNVVSNWDFDDPRVPNVFLLEFGKWADDITTLNARLAGMDQTNSNYTLQRLGCAKFPPSKAMICTNLAKPDSCTCNRNMVSIDGLHWCMESIGGRTLAGMMCLLQCPLQHQSSADTRVCEAACNERFMSLAPIIL